MSTTYLEPTTAEDPDNSYTVESNALVLDGNGTPATGDGKLILRQFDGRLSIPSNGIIAGIEVDIWAYAPPVTLQNDTFTESGALLKDHDGELNCNWQKPFTGNTPAYQKINSAGRTYYTFLNEGGLTINGSEHFTNAFTVPIADYYVEAGFYAATIVGDIAEIYARASLPYTFYILQYTQTDNTWRIGKCTGSRTVAGQLTELDSWVMPGGISVGSQAIGRLECRGNIIKGYVDGIERMSASDASITSAGFVGCRLDPGVSGSGPRRDIPTITPVEEPPPPGDEMEPVEEEGIDEGGTLGTGAPGEPDLPNDGLQFSYFKVVALPPDHITVSLSKDGGATIEGTGKTLALTDSYVKYTLGSTIDQWGGEWEGNDIRSDLFSIVVEKNYAPSVPLIDFSRAIIYHTGSGDTFMSGYRETTRQRIQYGWESTYGTASTPNKLLRATNFQPQTNADFKTHRPAGEKLESEHIVVQEWSTASLSGIPCYNELGVQLSMLTGLPTTNGTTNERQNHFFRFDNRGEQKGRSITAEYGEDPTVINLFGEDDETFNRGSRVKAYTMAELGLEFSRSDASLSGQMFGHKIELDHVMTAGANDVQTITITATGGTCAIRFNGSAWITLTLPPANAAAIDTALETISTIGASGLAVTGTGPFIVTFNGTGFAGKAQPLLEIDPTNATGGTVTIAHTTVGGTAEFPIVPIEPGHINIYLSDTYATLSSNRMQRCSMSNFTFTDRFSQFWAFNRSNGNNFIDRAEGTGIAGRFAIKAHADSEATSLLGTARSNAKKFMRIEAVGPTAYGSDKYELILDACVKVGAVGTLEDENGMYMANYELALVEDRNWGYSLTAWLKNMMTSANYQ